LIGLFEGASFPAVYYFFPIWIPNPEKAVMVSVTASGMYFGEILGVSISGVIVNKSLWINGEDWGGWPLVFYLFGLLGFVWFPVYAFLAYESPETHPKITQLELDLFKENRALQFQGNGTDDEQNHTVPLSPNRKRFIFQSSHEYDQLKDPSSSHDDKTVSSSISPTRAKRISSTEYEMVTFSPLNEEEKNETEATDSKTDLESDIEDITFSRSGDAGSHSDYIGNPNSSSIPSSQRRFTKDEIASSPPWFQFFTHPVLLAYYCSSATFVRDFLFSLF
jgi:hypothetical protein